jgi:hypothetical protein
LTSKSETPRRDKKMRSLPFEYSVQSIEKMGYILREARGERAETACQCMLFPVRKAHNDGHRTPSKRELMVLEALLHQELSRAIDTYQLSEKSRELWQAWIVFATTSTWDGIEAAWMWGFGDAELEVPYCPSPEDIYGECEQTDEEEHYLVYHWGTLRDELAKAKDCQDVDEAEEEGHEWQRGSEEKRSRLNPNLSALDIRTRQACAEIWFARADQIRGPAHWATHEFQLGPAFYA